MSRVIPVSGIGNADAWFEDTKPAAVKQLAYNGLTYDVVQGNTQGTLLASAARTATVNTPNQTNYNARGVTLFLDVTVASGTGGLSIFISYVDSVTGKGRQLNVTPVVVTAIGTYMYTVYPAAMGGAYTQASNAILPRTWVVQINHGDVTSYTYSIGYTLHL